jgi:hypothetical protein
LLSLVKCEAEQRRKTYIDLSPRTIWRSKVLGPSIKAKPVPAPQSLESVPGAHAIEYVVAVASCRYH